jgi:hypothetical protein
MLTWHGSRGAECPIAPASPPRSNRSPSVPSVNRTPEATRWMEENRRRKTNRRRERCGRRSPPRDRIRTRRQWRLAMSDPRSLLRRHEHISSSAVARWARGETGRRSPRVRTSQRTDRRGAGGDGTRWSGDCCSPLRRSHSRPPACPAMTAHPIAWPRRWPPHPATRHRRESRPGRTVGESLHARRGSRRLQQPGQCPDVRRDGNARLRLPQCSCGCPFVGRATTRSSSSAAEGKCSRRRP